MKELYFILLLMLVAGLAFSAVVSRKAPRQNLSPSGNSPVHQTSERLKRQTTGSNWVTGPFSECSATCGGGIRVRSVRCLTEDGVISFDCDINSAPRSYNFCNQIDCTTGDPDSSLIPDDGSYPFSMPNASLDFTDLGSGRFSVTLEINEPDGTSSRQVDNASPTSVNTTRTVSPSTPDIVVDGSSNLLVNNDPVINLNSIEQTDIPSGETVQLQNNMIVLSNGTVIAPDVNMFTYFDGFRFYNFTTSTVNPFNGPGKLYYNPNTGQALYSIVAGFNSQIDMQIPTSPPMTDIPTDSDTDSPPLSTTLLPPETTAPPPETTAPPPSTTAPPPVTSAPLPETSAPPPETSAPPPETSAPPPETSAPPPETSAPPPETTAEPVTTSAEASTSPPSTTTSAPPISTLPQPTTSLITTTETPEVAEDLCDRTGTRKKSKRSKRKKTKKSKKRKSRKSIDPCEEDDDVDAETTKKSRKKPKKTRTKSSSSLSSSSRSQSSSSRSHSSSSRSHSSSSRSHSSSSRSHSSSPRSHSSSSRSHSSSSRSHSSSSRSRRRG